MSEHFRESPLSSIEQEPFRKETLRPGFVQYTFRDDVGIGFDTTGKNYKELPEIHFGNPDDRDKAFLQEEKKEGVDMHYVAECVLVAMEDAGYREVWFYPYGKDTRESAQEALRRKLIRKNPTMSESEIEMAIEKHRSAARLRLFKKFAAVRPDEKGVGYIATI